MHAVKSVEHLWGQKYHDHLVCKYGKGNVLGMFSRKPKRSIYFMLKRKESFDIDKFLN